MKNYVVLIADDDQAWCHKLRKQIEELNVFTVLQPTHDGGATIESIEEYRPDVLILDLVLPLYDGLYIVNYIHRQMNGYNPFIYVLSAIGTDKTNRIMRNLEADYYSIKPITANAVADNLLTLTQEWSPAARCYEPGTDADQAPDPPESIDIEKQVDDYLYELGAPLYRISTRCLRIALRLALEDDTVLNSSMKLYAKIGEHPEIKSKSSGAIERNIRTTIKIMQETRSPYFLECFPKNKGKLTNTDFLQSSLYILRLRIEEFLNDKVSFRKNSDLRL